MAKTTVIFLLGIFFLHFFAPDLHAAKKKKYPRISRITLRSTNVFDLESAPYLNKFPYSWINFLHIKTNDRIIKQEFLFKVGDPADPFVLLETERNLRALPFINAARIAQFPQRDGTVAIVVYVSDSWTTEPYIAIGGLNKLSTPQFGFKEKNLFGMGKQIDFSYDEKNQFEKVFHYNDPRFLSSRWQLDGQEIQNQMGEERKFNLGRPFFSADTKWATNASYDKQDQIIQDFQNNVAVSQYNMSREVSQFSGAMKIGGGREIVNHAGLRYKLDRSWFSRRAQTDPNRDIPKKDDIKTVYLDMSTTRNKFLKLRRIEKMTRVEDFNAGPAVVLSPGLSNHLLTGQKTNTYFDGSYNQSFYSPGIRFITSQFSYSGRDLTRKPENQTFLLDSRYYHLPLPNQTLLTRARVELGKDLDPDNQLTVGSNVGLRAYHAEQAVGNKSLVFNAEDRFDFVDELWSLFSIGGAIFFDSGYAWPQGQQMDFRKMLNDVGAGLRIGLTRSSDEVILRFDVAYRLTPTEDLKNEFVVSFGSGQAF